MSSKRNFGIIYLFFLYILTSENNWNFSTKMIYCCQTINLEKISEDDGVDEKGIVVEGFYFVDEKVAEQARREAEGVKYIKENMNLENQDAVMQMYHKLLTEELFETPIGIGFLKELRDYLCTLPSVDEQELEVISTELFFREKEVDTVKKEKEVLPGEEKEDTLIRK